MKKSTQYSILILQRTIEMFSAKKYTQKCLECPRSAIFEPTFDERDSYIVLSMSGRKLIPFGQRKTDGSSAVTHLAWLGIKSPRTAFWIILIYICFLGERA